jgi:glycosyltransferase involved in cell wall biosynthesis
VKDVVVDILSAESSGDFLDTIKNCGATIISTSHEATSSAFSSTKKSKIIIEPALSLAVLKDSKEIELNPSLLLYLSTVNAVIALNTLGDVQTDALLTYVSVIRSNTLNPTQRRFPKVYLDLCNLPEFDDMFKGKWMSIVDGFIAPSQYVQYHYQTLQHHKPVALVYPSLDYNNSATSDPYNDVVRNIWPRKVNGRFRIGCIGRLSYDRNPGLCIHALATLLNRHNDLYNTFNLEFVVIGGGSLLNDMIALAKDLNILEYITFLGARKNVERDLALLDLAVNTKVQGETFGILNVECMMTKTPVIAFNRSANQESLHPLSRILIENISVDELVNAIIGVVVSPEKYGLSVSGLTQAEREMRLIVNPVIQAQKMIGVLYNMWLTDQSM